MSPEPHGAATAAVTGCCSRERLARTGPVDGQQEPASTLVTGGAMAPDEPVYGRRLTREEALVHSWLPRFWKVNDLILTGIPAVHTHWTHQPTSRQRRQWWQI